MKKMANNYHVPNLDRALVILDILSKHPAGLNRNEIAAASHCSATMVYRIVMTLSKNGFLFRDEASGRYRLSLKLLDIGVAGSDEYSLTHVAWPEMTALRESLLKFPVPLGRGTLRPPPVLPCQVPLSAALCGAKHSNMSAGGFWRRCAPRHSYHCRQQMDGAVHQPDHRSRTQSVRDQHGEN